MSTGAVAADVFRRRFFLSLLAVALPLILLGYRGVIDSGDGMQRYAGAVALLRGEGYVVADADNAFRPLKYGPAHSGLALPLIVAAHLLAPHLLRFTTFDQAWHELLYEDVRQGGFMLLMPLLTLATALLLAATLRLLGASPPRAWWLTLLWLLATPALVYANLAFDEPLQALLLLAGAHAALRGRGATSALWFGLALFTRVSMLVYVPVGYILLDRNWCRLPPARRRFVGVMAGMLLLQLVYLRGHFGMWLETGYSGADFSHPQLTGLYGLLLSPGKSIFLFAPPLLLLLAHLPRIWRERRECAAAAGYVLTAFILLISSCYFWSGDTCWGPRYVLAVLPLLFLPLTFVRVPARWWVMLGILGLLVNLPALAVPYQDLWQQVLRENGQDDARAFHAWYSSATVAPAAALTLAAHGAAADTMLLARRWWRLVPGLPALPAALCLLFLYGIWHRPRFPALN